MFFQNLIVTLHCQLLSKVFNRESNPKVHNAKASNANNEFIVSNV